MFGVGCSMFHINTQPGTTLHHPKAKRFRNAEASLDG